MTEQTSQSIKAYFEGIQEYIKNAHDLAQKARKMCYDPENMVESTLAKNMAERVVGLISVIAPQIQNNDIKKRIIELENQYGALDWRIAFVIALEIAEEKFCKFKDKKEAIEVGIRTGFAYSTCGIVSSPLDGLIGIEFKKRLDNRGEYLILNFAGPIRNAGGTSAAVCVLIGDYVRKKMGYDIYDATEDEIKRTITELQDYHERVTNLQYFPSPEEITFLMKNMPVQISGDPSEDIEVSNFKDLPRITTNLIRSGFCLIMSSCIPLKAPKLWKQLNKWGKDFDMDQWNFFEEFILIQKKAKAKGTEKLDKKISPDYTYISDLVAGRPVIGHPLSHGSFRLRYGRSRISGFSAQSIHPATMYILNQYLATGTQIKVERPGKAAALTNCDYIDGPIVKLQDSEVIQLKTLQEAKKYFPLIQEIIYLGDTLISYGDFFNRAHPLVPAGYCQEWWIQELEEACIKLFGKIDAELLSEKTKIPAERIEKILKFPLTTNPTGEEAVILSKILSIPIHPEYTYYWNVLKQEQFLSFLKLIEKSNIIKSNDKIEKITLPNNPEKRFLELIGIPHKLVQNEFIVIKGDHAIIFTELFKQIKPYNKEPILEYLTNISSIKVCDKAGIFIGARMGRPEKAKQRKLTGNPHMLFPVGEEGGKFRSIQASMEKGIVTADFAQFFCKNCNKDTILSRCETCNKITEKKYYCKICGQQNQQECPKHGKNSFSKNTQIKINEYFKYALQKLSMKTYPNLIKGVRGTSNQNHIPEHIAKGILRAKHNIHVNKDGTTRYDMTQLPITHFKPKEVQTSITKLKEFGYEKDIYGKPLENEDQILEIKPQDIFLPASAELTEEGAHTLLFRVSQFIDELLTNFYGLKPFYSLKNEKDLIGHFVVCLAPHTSAGIIGRIAGFTKTQGFFAHPLLHAATRRDCDGDEACVFLLMDAFLNYSKHYLPNTRGATMDAPLVITSILIPAEVDDMAFDLDRAWRYPKELYQASLEYKMPWEVSIEQLKSYLGKPEQYEGYGFTHDVSDLNNTVNCSAYKTLPSMEEKLKGQMELAEKIRAVDTSNVAELVIEKHFLKDTKGNLRKFSTQEFRCVACNEKYRRPPIVGKCIKCNGRLIFTVSEGNIIKYLEPTISLAKKYNVSPYLMQTIEILQQRIEGVFGKEKEKQTGLGAWFG
ncbi:DNA polymerase II large subunit [Candidatus Woesearchaeota archaeon]|nr:DNA polymerase II large subunit [Candidatus Woesearchaeota archaeon]